MPIYEYRCSACGHQVEVIHGIHDQGPVTCVVCGGAMRKALSSPAILFKGSGWAKKDAQAASRPRSTGDVKAEGDSTRDAGGSATGDSTGGASKSRPDGGATESASKPAATTTGD